MVCWNLIYDIAVSKILKYKQSHGKYELDALGLFKLVDESWNEVWLTNDEAKCLMSLFEQQNKYKEIEAIEGAKLRLRNALLPYIMIPPKDVGAESQVEQPLPICNGYYWSLMRNHLENKFQIGVVKSIDHESSRVLRHILMPKDGSDFKKFGLVMGQVQSGKTANYSALIAKACDFGYKIIVVLSGVHNDLRQQTQERLDEEFLGFHEYLKHNKKGKKLLSVLREPCGVGLDPDYVDSKAPTCMTYTDQDFQGKYKSGATGVHPPVLVVVKKNQYVLDQLNDFFGTQLNKRQYGDWPVLIIDDEADQASVNTKKEESTSVINKFIRKFIKKFNKATFVGYTATPFANVLINARAKSQEIGSDLFPKDFIVRLATPPNYFGPLQFFGNNHDDRGLELFMPISRTASDKLTGITRDGKTGRLIDRGPVILESLPEECRILFKQFLLSAAIKQWRHKRLYPNKWKENSEENEPILETSMLIHVSHLVEDQRRVASAFNNMIEDEFRALVLGAADECELAMQGMEELFLEQITITDTVRNIRKNCDLMVDWSLPETFDELIPEIKQVLEDLSVKKVNGEKEMDELAQPYSDIELDDQGRRRTAVVVFIGGNKLSRGLTLPGLCVSLFLRATNMYDTLLQMGRWFGYRDGYVDLCRICTTSNIINNFRRICEACIDFDSQIDRMSAINRTPENYRLNILKHTGLLVTARNKMRNVREAKVSFNGYIIDIRCLGLYDEVLEKNFRVTSRFIDGVKILGQLAYASKDYKNIGIIGDEEVAAYEGGSQHPSGRLWRKVPASVICNLLGDFVVGDNKENCDLQGIIKHIEKANKRQELVNWNVFIPGKADSDPKNIFGSTFSNRTMIIDNYNATDFTTATLRTLKAGGHEFIGVPKDVISKAHKKLAASEFGRKDGALYQTVREVAGEMHSEEGYLILYLMRPKADQKNKAVLDNLDELSNKLGYPVPVVSYYMWLPQTPNDYQTSLAIFNKTVMDLDEEEDDSREDIEDEK